MRIRASWWAAALLAVAGCGESVPSGGTADGRQAVVDDGDTAGEAGGALGCMDARAAFRGCRAAAPSCEGQADALRACVLRHAPAGEDGRPPRRGGGDMPPPPGGDDGRPPRDGDDGRPPRDGDDGRPPRDGDDGRPPRDGDDGDAPHYEIPEECQPLATELAACMHPCVEEREVMVQTCVGECRTARQAAQSCLQTTSACASPREGMRDCLHSARRVCGEDMAADGSEPSQACLEAVAACLSQGNACETACGPLVRTARQACGALAHGRPHGGHAHSGGDPGHGSRDPDEGRCDDSGRGCSGHGEGSSGGGSPED